MPTSQPEIPDGAASRRRLFGVTLIATVAVTVLPLPWRLSGLVFAGIAGWAGVTLLADLTTLRRAGGAAPGWLSVIAGLGLATFMIMRFGLEIALYPMLADHERCLSQAITHLDRQQCQTTLEQREEKILERLRATP
jgi:hypothetical protein